MEIKFKINEKDLKKFIDVSRKYFKWKNNEWQLEWILDENIHVNLKIFILNMKSCTEHI